MVAILQSPPSVPVQTAAVQKSEKHLDKSALNSNDIAEVSQAKRAIETAAGEQGVKNSLSFEDGFRSKSTSNLSREETPFAQDSLTPSHQTTQEEIAVEQIDDSKSSTTLPLAFEGSPSKTKSQLNSPKESNQQVAHETLIVVKETVHESPSAQVSWQKTPPLEQSKSTTEKPAVAELSTGATTAEKSTPSNVSKMETDNVIEQTKVPSVDEETRRVVTEDPNANLTVVRETDPQGRVKSQIPAEFVVAQYAQQALVNRQIPEPGTNYAESVLKGKQGL